MTTTGDDINWEGHVDVEVHPLPNGGVRLILIGETRTWVDLDDRGRRNVIRHLQRPGRVKTKRRR